MSNAGNRRVLWVHGARPAGVVAVGAGGDPSGVVLANSGQAGFVEAEGGGLEAVKKAKSSGAQADEKGELAVTTAVAVAKPSGQGGSKVGAAATIGSSSTTAEASRGKSPD